MSVEAIYKCDVCGAQTSADVATFVQAGPRSQPLIIGTVDVCPGCVTRPLVDILQAIKTRVAA